MGLLIFGIAIGLFLAACDHKDAIGVIVALGLMALIGVVTAVEHLGDRRRAALAESGKGERDGR